MQQTIKDARNLSFFLNLWLRFTESEDVPILIVSLLGIEHDTKNPAQASSINLPSMVHGLSHKLESHPYSLILLKQDALTHLFATDDNKKRDGTRMTSLTSSRQQTQAGPLPTPSRPD
jgi:hypothetical protein